MPQRVSNRSADWGGHLGVEAADVNAYSALAALKVHAPDPAASRAQPPARSSRTSPTVSVLPPALCRRRFGGPALRYGVSQRIVGRAEVKKAASRKREHALQKARGGLTQPHAPLLARFHGDRFRFLRRVKMRHQGFPFQTGSVAKRSHVKEPRSGLVNDCVHTEPTRCLRGYQNYVSALFRRKKQGAFS